MFRRPTERVRPETEMPGAVGRPTVALFRRLFLMTGLAFVFGTAVLVFSPVTVSAPILLRELAVLGVGLTLMLALNAFLLREAVS